MQHLQYLITRAHNPAGQISEDGQVCGQPLDVPDDGENQHISGHALMATATPLSHIMNTPETRHSGELAQLHRPDLLNLLNMCNQLPWISEQELPPVKAWLRILRDECLNMLSVNDFELIKADLLQRVRCYR